MAKRKNPIEQRLALVNDEWVEFAEKPDARVLCLLVTADEGPMVDMFVALESDARAGSLPDVFVRLASPFDGKTPYGFALCGEFLPIAEAMHEGLESPETPAWVPPQHARGEDDIALWIKTAGSFSQHYALPGHLAALLVPAAVADAAAYQLWLQQLALRSPTNMRAIVLDDVKAPELKQLVSAEPVRVVAAPLDLDMPGARLEISQEAGGLDTPGGQFRHLFVKLSNALGEGNLAEAEGFGKLALGIAQSQSWFALAVPIHFILGAAQAGAGQPNVANERYMLAEIAATEGEKAGDPSCTKLRAQARMVRGGLLVTIGQYPAAAKLFIEAIPLATAAQDPRMVLDCHRLASFSFEQSKQYDKAWQSGVDGLGYAKQLDLETRQTSSLPYLGVGMLRIAELPEYKSAEFQIEREMVGLLGRTDWRPQTAAAPSPASPAKPAGAHS